MFLAETLQETYLPVLLQVAIAIALPVAILVASWFFGQRAKPNKIKDSAYECGLNAEDKPHPRFSVKFYVTAMLFILFDIEVVFLVPWATVFSDMVAIDSLKVFGFVEMLIFMGILALGDIYAWAKGALEWE